MEEKPSVTSSTGTVANDSPATSTRRRGGAQKRKASSTLSTSSPSPTPSKRLTREKAAAAAAVSYLSPMHNGPQTRARHSPGNFAASTVEGKKPAAVDGVKVGVPVSVLEEQRSKLEDLEKEIEAEFEAIRSRDSNVHIVPNHCGWFSWTKIHPLEECALPSFFDGKSQTRTRDTYLQIRNWMLKKFHANPNSQIESKDLSECEVGDSDARQEVLEFVDYWGLINFHPFPQLDSAAVANPDEEAEKNLLAEKLFRFEDLQPCSPKPSLTAPAVPSGLFPDSAITEELAKLEEPSVEYHCNSCSADCSRKRYHCQTQADYDLCADCFNDGKFGSSMSSSDFILMESAEAPGATGGNWTDQETLLLLEAVELFSENWNEIAEHVATKTKAQCILHFVQMPIEDAFFVSDGDIGDSSKEADEVGASIDDMSAAKGGPETIQSKASDKEDPPSTSPMEASKPQDASDGNISPETTKTDNANEIIVGEEISKSDDTGEVKKDANIAVKALTEAFEAVGYIPTPENRLSFADVGNPVMALAGFLARLGGPEVVNASTRCSLKSLSSTSPGMQLATRHCFILEDPPNDGKELAENCASEMANQEAKKDGLDEENKKSSPKEQKLGDASNDQSTQMVTGVNGVGAAALEDSCNSKDSTNLDMRKDHSPSISKESNEIKSTNSLKEGAKKADHSKHAEVAKDEDLSTDLKSQEENGKTSASVSIKEPSKTVEASEDAGMVPECRPSEKNKSATTVEDQKDNSTKKLDHEVKDEHSIDKITRAAISALSGAAVKAKLLAKEEEEQIQHLTASLIEKQLRKLETKLAFFQEMDGVFMRVRDQLDRSRQRLQQERQQIIMARFQASSSRPMAPAMPGNRIMNIANMVPRPVVNMASQLPPISRPMIFGRQTITPSFVMPTTTSGSSIRPSGGDQFSSAVTK